MNYKDLIARLRNQKSGPVKELRDACEEAADTLERYKAALREIANRDDSIGDDARQALNGEPS